MPMQYASYDQQTAESFVSLTLNDTEIEFQFAPKIVSDSQAGNWEEKPSNAFAEPVAVYKGASARTITLEWTYVLDGGEWTADKIASILQQLRGYFRSTLKTYQQLIGKVSLSKHGGSDPISCRLVSGDIKHSGPVINGEFHLRTDVVATLKLWVNLKDQPIQAMAKVDILTPDWY